MTAQSSANGEPYVSTPAFGGVARAEATPGHSVVFLTIPGQHTVTWHCRDAPQAMHLAAAINSILEKGPEE